MYMSRKKEDEEEKRLGGEGREDALMSSILMARMSLDFRNDPQP
jgi:hypothetical protein